MFDNIRPVSISSRACRQIHLIMKAKAIPSQYGLRVGVRGGGCGRVSLIIGFDTRKDTDLVYDVEGIPVYVDKKHTMYVMGRQVDFIDEADGKGFIFVSELRDPH